VGLTACSHYEVMRIIKRGAVEQLWQKHPDAKASLESWYAVVRRANWQTRVEMKRTIFNIAGNEYRMIARVNYETQRVFVLHLLTHAEYDRGDWKP
jgi:mRNA interferase HigB